MNQLCKVCGEPAAGFHFGAFTCEGCKSFFGRTYNNIAAIAGCKNNGDCVINKKNRTACKACRLRKCLVVGMSKSGSRYGRRSNWFKIHCLLQEQQTSLSGQMGGGSGSGGGGGGGGGAGGDGDAATGSNASILNNNRSTHNLEQLARLHSMHARQTYQDKTNPCIKSAVNMTNVTAAAAAAAAVAASLTIPSTTPSSTLSSFLSPANKFLNGCDMKQENNLNTPTSSEMLKIHLSDTPSDSGASSAGDVIEDGASNPSTRQQLLYLTTTTMTTTTTTAPAPAPAPTPALALSLIPAPVTTTTTTSTTAIRTNDTEHHYSVPCDGGDGERERDEGGGKVDESILNEPERKHQQLLEIFCSQTEPFHNPFVAFNFNLLPAQQFSANSTLPAIPYTTLISQKSEPNMSNSNQQDEPIDLSLKTTRSPDYGQQTLLVTKKNLGVTDINRPSISKPAALDLTLVRTSSAPLSG